tara:strand:+ start:738 stop:2117 length:1380 start_codon:yes stop_codon:yes gene_type:complete
MVTDKFDYLINFWFGPRSSSKQFIYEKGKAERERNNFGQWYYQIHQYYLLNAHCKFLKKHLDKLPINNIVFVVNVWKERHKPKEIKEVIKWYGLENKIEIIYHDNSNHSYGAWNAGLKKLAKHSDSRFVFNCEDDYLPVDERFYQPFYEQFINNVGYVAQYVTTLPTHVNLSMNENGEYIVKRDTKRHAAVSNGFISLECVKDLIKKTGEVYNLKNIKKDSRDTRNNVQINERAAEQIFFTDNLENNGYSITDISKTCNIPFDNNNCNNEISFGKLGAYTPIKPYKYPNQNVRLRKLEEKDLKFLLEVRNDDSTRNFLYDNSIFNLDQAKEWFKTLKLPWFIIDRKHVIEFVTDERRVMNNMGRDKYKIRWNEVGYFRRTMKDDGIEEIGCDIHPNNRRKGYAKEAYIERLKHMDKAILEVFEDNHARQMYFDLGFRDTGKTSYNRGRKEYQMIWKRTI